MHVLWRSSIVAPARSQIEAVQRDSTGSLEVGDAKRAVPGIGPEVERRRVLAEPRIATALEIDQAEMGEAGVEALWNSCVFFSLK